MNEEMKVKIPDGYRWVKPGEDRNGRIWKTQQGGYWCDTIMPNCCSEYHIITPIETPKPEMVDVEIVKCHGQLVFTDPNRDAKFMAYLAPCIVGPDWAFAGFVWEGDNQERTNYYTKHNDLMPPIYAKAVRFRRVGGAK